MGGARTTSFAAAVLSALLLTACGGGAPSRTSTATAAGAAASRRCTVREGEPDPRCTPGATDPAVTQHTIASTICRPAWVRAARRLPAARLATLERRQLRAYGFYAGRGPSGYVEDALIPAALGGRESDPRDLWPQARAPAPAA